MKYTFELSKTAVKDIQKLPHLIKKRVVEKLLFLESQSDPLSFGAPLKGNKSGDFRFRVGDYRVLCDIDKNHIVIRSVRHRRESYSKQESGG